jgi:hypothetical protein
MRLAPTLAAFLLACGPPSWPATIVPGVPDVEPATVFAVVPADPIEGEEIALIVPTAPDGRCHAFGATMRREETPDAVALVAEPTSAEACPPVARSGSGSIVALGALAAGSYVVRAGELDLSFSVRPPATSPGPPPLFWRVAHEIATTHGVESSCSDRSEPTYRPWRLRDPRLHHQVAAAHPEWSEDEIEAAMCGAQSVEVRGVSERELRYRHFAGGLCHVAHAIGTVRVAADGTFEVGEPYVVHGEDVPC